MKILVDSKIISQIISEEHWCEDNFGYRVCMFCLNTYPEHEDDCPWALLKKIFNDESKAASLSKERRYHFESFCVKS